MSTRNSFSLCLGSVLLLSSRIEHKRLTSFSYFSFCALNILSEFWWNDSVSFFKLDIISAHSFSDFFMNDDDDFFSAFAVSSSPPVLVAVAAANFEPAAEPHAAEPHAEGTRETFRTSPAPSPPSPPSLSRSHPSPAFNLEYASSSDSESSKQISSGGSCTFIEFAPFTVHTSGKFSYILYISRNPLQTPPFPEFLQ